MRYAKPRRILVADYSFPGQRLLSSDTGLRKFDSILQSRGTHVLAFGLLLLGASALQPARHAAAQSCPRVVWADEFDGTSLDLNKWSYQVGDGCAEGICGWGNNELQYYQSENVTVSGGMLKIEARQQRVRNKQYTSGRIRSLSKGEWTFGRFEARIRLTQGQGIWPAFWMLPTDEVYGGWPQSGEIDVMENVGHEPDVVHGTIHFGDPWPANQNSGASFRLHEGIFADGFHEFAIEKEAGVIRWFVDGVLYSSKTTADTDPFLWPFDERFHFLLNVAVGGNWPGNPDATTVFPQVLQVDYVRVYDGNKPHIAGDRVVAHEEAGVAYSVGNAAAGSSYSWSVPAGATIVSGQGTSSIVVDWGSEGGAIIAQVGSSCGSTNLILEVQVEEPYEREFSFENFDEPASMTLDVATGTLVEVANPDPSGINPSALSGQYTRNSSQQYDVVAYNIGVIGDASLYTSKQKKFYIDLYSSAPVGSTVLLQLESGSLATPTNYPTGRHSRYQARTTVQNQWERIELPLLDTPDPSTPDGGLDKLILLFAPNTFTGHTYTFDNLDSYAVAGGGSPPTEPTAVHVSSIVEGTQAAGQGAKHGTATVTILDDLGDPVQSAVVTGTFSGDFNEAASGNTGPDGTVTLVTTGTKKGGVNFTFCVDDVSHATLDYDAGANEMTCSDGAGKASGTTAEAPQSFALHQNYPNPFNPSTEISYRLGEAGRVELAVFDLLGKQVAILVDGVQSEGSYTVRFDAADLPGGTYVYRLTAADEVRMRKMILVK